LEKLIDTNKEMGQDSKSDENADYWGERENIE
jgi:hypothetical protein